MLLTSVIAIFAEETYYSMKIEKATHGDIPALMNIFEAAKNIDLSPAYEEIQKMMITELKMNYSDLLQRIMMKTMVDGLCGDWGFRNNLESAIHEIMIRRANQ